jgi:hypothetical protein
VILREHGEKDKARHCGINGRGPAMPGRMPFMPQKALFYLLTGWLETDELPDFSQDKIFH